MPTIIGARMPWETWGRRKLRLSLIVRFAGGRETAMSHVEVTGSIAPDNFLTVAGTIYEKFRSWYTRNWPAPVAPKPSTMRSIILRRSSTLPVLGVEYAIEIVWSRGEMCLLTLGAPGVAGLEALFSMSLGCSYGGS